MLPDSKLLFNRSTTIPVIPLSSPATLFISDTDGLHPTLNSFLAGAAFVVESSTLARWSLLCLLSLLILGMNKGNHNKGISWDGIKWA
jgi:hypothetical protein